MQMLTVREAAQTTGWSARMLRYVEQIGLVAAARSEGGYRLYGPEQLQRLRTLRDLLSRHGLDLSDVGFARRLRTDDELRGAVEHWLESPPRRPVEVEPADWLAFEQDKHQRLLAGPPTGAYRAADATITPTATRESA